MRFCPTCGTRLVLVHDKKSIKTVAEYKCGKCSYTSSISPSQDHVTVESRPLEEVVVVFDKGLELSTMSTIRAECPKCHNNLAYVWQVQTRSGDEGSTSFYRMY
jgi:DNA-directed RNA polymerase subunit M